MRKLSLLLLLIVLVGTVHSRAVFKRYAQDFENGMMNEGEAEEEDEDEMMDDSSMRYQPMPADCRGGAEIVRDGYTYCLCKKNRYGFSCKKTYENPCSSGSLYGQVDPAFAGNASLSREFFIQCNWGTPHVMRCPATTIWNNNIFNCELRTREHDIVEIMESEEEMIVEPELQPIPMPVLITLPAPMPTIEERKSIYRLKPSEDDEEAERFLSLSLTVPTVERGSKEVPTITTTTTTTTTPAPTTATNTTSESAEAVNFSLSSELEKLISDKIKEIELSEDDQEPSEIFVSNIGIKPLVVDNKSGQQQSERVEVATTEPTEILVPTTETATTTTATSTTITTPRRVNHVDKEIEEEEKEETDENEPEEIFTPRNQVQMPVVEEIVRDTTSPVEQKEIEKEIEIDENSEPTEIFVPKFPMRSAGGKVRLDLHKMITKPSDALNSKNVDKVKYFNKISDMLEQKALQEPNKANEEDAERLAQTIAEIAHDAIDPSEINFECTGGTLYKPKESNDYPYCICPGRKIGLSCATAFDHPCMGQHGSYYPVDDEFTPDLRLSKSFFIQCDWFFPRLKKCAPFTVWDPITQVCAMMRSSMSSNDDVETD